MIYVLATCIAVGLSLGGAYAYWVFLAYRFSVISKGQAYQSAQMPMNVLLETVRQHGIRCVIDLRRDGDYIAEERETLAGVGVAYFHFPSPQVPSEETIEQCLEIMDRPENRPLLIHCKHGEGRSLLVAAVFRMEYEGWSNRRAWRALRVLPQMGSFAEHRRKGKFILNYVPRRYSSLGSSPRGTTPLPEPVGKTR